MVVRCLWLSTCYSKVPSQHHIGNNRTSLRQKLDIGVPVFLERIVQLVESEYLTPSRQGHGTLVSVQVVAHMLSREHALRLDRVRLVDQKSQPAGANVILQVVPYLGVLQYRYPQLLQMTYNPLQLSNDD